MGGRAAFFAGVGTWNYACAVVDLLLYLHFNKHAFGLLSVTEGTLAIICYLASLALILE